ncbi:hypothetical protein A5634_04985 [Mycobacterium asiaticum]|uniref:DUF4226 domain-containing protein n=1 Tax=Mycobacterium asiaticum TaxID=1790 RepID=A0A1A3NPJ7_MYCAS|nr:DUF4226 domain-containing protein [Mycobacterium asiaticum]OBK23791.1 hypothetical protein A5634_04985 [Mycobacterium asiaticum]
MSDQTGSSAAALAQRQAALASRRSTIAEADRLLAEVLASAHETLRDSVSRLDAIAADIERARELTVDTAMGAREFQKFLLAKQREITGIVTEARDLSRAKSVVLHGLREQYRR